MRTPIRRLVPFVLVGLLAPVAGQEKSPAVAAFAGEWRGEILPPAALKVTIVLRQADGGWQGTIDIPAQGADDLPLQDVAVDGNKIRFAIADVPGAPTFDGSLAGDTIDGAFTQGGQKLKFTLTRAAAAAAASHSKFDGMQQWLDATRTMFEVPGVAVAIVEGDKLVATLVSGQRDVAGKLPVTTDTLFAIGSSTKAFTTCLLAMLVDDGKLDWDKPVRSYLPEFALADAAIGDRLTPRDLVTHRSGMPRHDLMWYGATFDRADMVRRLRHLPLNHDLRTHFQYNNLMYLTAGHLAEVLLGTSYEQAVSKRILEPLGMARATFDAKAMTADPDRALPYRRDDGDVEPMPFRDIMAIGPAGSLNASVAAMANWASLQLGSGAFAGKRLLSKAAAEDLHVLRMPMHDPSDPEVFDIGYASGWFIDVYRGHRRVHHGGNIDGYSALVAFLPTAGYGFVVLTNLNATPLPDIVVRTLSDRALGLSPSDVRDTMHRRLRAAEAAGKQAKERGAAARHRDTTPSLQLGAYVGHYAHPGYGDCHISQDARGLRLSLHGLEVGLDHWHYDVFAGRKEDGEAQLADSKVQFQLDFDGDIEGLRMVLDPSVPAMVFAPQPDARLRDAAFLSTLVGHYELERGAADITRSGEQLVVTLPGQRYVLLPQRGLRFQLEGLTGYSVEFVLGEKGEAKELRFRQPDGIYLAKRQQQ